MKIALIHDYIKEYGGAERVLEALHEIWPEAPVFTSVYLPQFLGPHRKRFDSWKIIPSRLQSFPFIHKLISPVRLLSPWIFENIELAGFDAVIVSATGAYFPNLLVRQPSTRHICYCHTPPRYLYGYPTARNWQKSKVGKLLATVINHYLRHIDFLSAQRPDFFIANSHETRRRIKKFYRREATVIYPPVEMAKNSEFRIQNSVKRKEKKYFLAGGRLARAKHIDLAIKACNELKLPLKVFGKSFADYGEELNSIAGPTVEFLGEVSDEELGILYLGAKALIYPSEEEDFGIIPVEAQSFGVPVIGFASGGVLETVIDDKTGLLFKELTLTSLTDAIQHFNDIYHLSKWEKACKANAAKFSKERFKREIRELVEKKIPKLNVNKQLIVS